MQLQSGQNVPIPSDDLVLQFHAQQAPSGYTLDYSCFALTAQGKVRNDDDFVFFNNRQLGSAVSLKPTGDCFTLKLSAMPDDIEKLAFCLTLQGGTSKGHTVAGLETVSCKVNGNAICFDLATHGRSEVALIMVEVYRRNSQWKFRAQGQGFNGGLQPLAEHFGVEIGEGEQQSQANPTPATSAPIITTPPPVSNINLNKITLEKNGDKISLEKKGQSLGEVIVNLKWQSSTQQKRGFFDSLLKSSGGAIDLDLGCLIELKDGSKGVVQALGGAFGSTNEAPFIQLDGDDRTGNSQNGETIRINGKHWNQIQRVLIFAFIYEGVPAWDQAAGRITINAPDQHEIEVHLDNREKGESICAIALLENVNGTMQIRKDARYFKGGHAQMDKEYGWGIRWEAGSK